MGAHYQPLEKIIENRLVTVSGTLVIVCNVLILTVINTNRDLRYRMCLQTFMAVADMVNFYATSSNSLMAAVFFSDSNKPLFYSLSAFFESENIVLFKRIFLLSGFLKTILF